MNKKLIRLTEGDLHRIVKKSVQIIVSEASDAPNAFKHRFDKHRFDPNKRVGDFPLEQPEWTKDPRWQGWNGEDPEWIMKQQEEHPYGGKTKQSVSVSESQLHQIIKESIQRIMNEGWFGNDAKYGEKWYNPFTWVSKADKAKQDQLEAERKKRLRDIARRKEAQEKEDAENYKKWAKYQAEKAQQNYRPKGGYYVHAGDTYYGGTSPYDAGLR